MLVVDERGFQTKSFPISTNTFFKFDKYFWTKSSFRKNLWGSWAASLSKNMAGCRCKSATLADFQRWAFPINKSADSQRLEHFLSHRQTNIWRIYRGEKWLLAVEGFEGRIFFNSVPFNWGAKIVAIQAFFLFFLKIKYFATLYRMLSHVDCPQWFHSQISVKSLFKIISQMQILNCNQWYRTIKFPFDRRSS